MAEISLQEFERRNTEAQRINAEIQKAQGALEENKRQFDALCKQYQDEFDEHVDASNIEVIFNRVYAEVEKAAKEQQIALEGAKNGIVINEKDVTNSGTSTTSDVAPMPSGAVSTESGVVSTASGAVAAPTNGASVPSAGAVPSQSTTGIPQFGQVAPNPVAQNGQAVFGAVQAPVGSAQTNFGAVPTGGQAVFGSVQPIDASQIPQSAMPQPVTPQPISASQIPQAAISNPVDIKQPAETATTDPIQPAYTIPGWGTADVDFNKILGGTFGGEA